ncbi:synembryn [Glossina fuscipes]|uniref:Synembryn n=1 Tax=Glossina fuscipes TaxID=7396 RepID=A0A8U0WKC4_9MUSC|nr:synembryn [Glossina fuscipes]
MDRDQLEHLRSKDPQKICEILERFNKKNANLFDFEKFHLDNLWLNLWQAIFKILNTEPLEKLHVLSLNTIRILSRDRLSLQRHNIDSDVHCLLKLARLTSSTSLIPETNCVDKNSTDVAAATRPESSDEMETHRIVEALKCLCNLVFQSADCRRRCVRQNVADHIIRRMSSTVHIPCALELFDTKLLFLITALESSVRSRVMIELNGLTYMTENLNEKLHSKEFNEEELDVMVELLKAMYNVISYTEKSPSENEIQNLHLTGVVRELLFRFGAMRGERERAIVSNCINLLVYVSSSCLSELMVKWDSEIGTIRVTIFDKHNIYALDVLLNFFHLVVEELENGVAHTDVISPVLTVLVKCVASNRIMRHYVRSVVLPPLKDVSQLPEVGTELRNYLCRLQGNADNVVRDLTYELLFLCCKKNPRRMVKHFGYGNMAGLFCKKGMLDCRRVETDFSTDSDDSDTEEYKKNQHAINPVTGSFITPQANPMQNMSEEEKEYHAMQLVNVIDKLHRGGLIKPCNIGDDGKLQPVDHILELQTGLIKNVDSHNMQNDN